MKKINKYKVFQRYQQSGMAPSGLARNLIYSIVDSINEAIEEDTERRASQEVEESE